MMAHGDDPKALATTARIMQAIACAILLVNLYHFIHPALQGLGFTHPYLDGFLARLQARHGLFTYTLPTKGLALLFLGLSVFGDHGRPKENATWKPIYVEILSGLILIGFNGWILELPVAAAAAGAGYAATLALGFGLCAAGAIGVGRMLTRGLGGDDFNVENEAFRQETRLVATPESVNLPTRFYYRRRVRRGWINLVNPFRATMVLGTPGSGKSFAIIVPFIKQTIEKGYVQYLYDFKFPDLTRTMLNHLRLYPGGYAKRPRLYIINFDDPRRSHRCNPLNPAFLTDISDAQEAAHITMIGLNRTWAQKQGDFFVESPILLLQAVIWFLRVYQGGRYCTLPHAIELLNAPYTELFPVLAACPDLEHLMGPFMDAWRGGAQDQLQGQIASAKIPMNRLISPALYWVMGGDDFTLDINDPEDPKLLAIGNNPDRQNIYSAALGLYNARVIKLINHKGKLPCAVVVDELPTMFFKGLDNLIATARSNRVAVCLGLQDFSQLNAEYGDKEAEKIVSTIGNVFSGAVVGRSAQQLSARFGKKVQRRDSLSINSSDTSSSISTQLDMLIPEAKIANLSSGVFVGSVAANFTKDLRETQRMRVFHGQILIDEARKGAEEAHYQDIPIIQPFLDPEGRDIMEEAITANYRQIKQDIKDLVAREVERIQADPALAHLLEADGAQGGGPQ